MKCWGFIKIEIFGQKFDFLNSVWKNLSQCVLKQRRKISNQIKIYKIRKNSIYFHYYSQNNACIKNCIKYVLKLVHSHKNKKKLCTFFKIYFMTISVCIIVVYKKIRCNFFSSIFSAKSHRSPFSPTFWCGDKSTLLCTHRQ